MNHSQKLDFIRQKAIEANSSIVKPKFGCKLTINWMKEDNDPKYYQTLYWPEDMCINHSDKEVIWNDITGEIIEILGRDITFADVLLAISKTGYRDCIGIHFDIDGCYIYNDDYGDCSGEKWNLLKPLHEQDEPTVSFIYELLK